MKVSTRQFLITAAGVCGIYALFVGRMVLRSVNEGDTGVALAEVAMFSVPLVLGLTIAWFKMLGDQKQRRNRKPPMNLP